MSNSRDLRIFDLEVGQSCEVINNFNARCDGMAVFNDISSCGPLILPYQRSFIYTFTCRIGE